ncbi:MAG: site-specific integrase [Aquabacterium sp.]
MSKLPKKTAYLVIKGGRFYFRVRIPDDLRQAFGKKEHTEALGDLNRAQADVRAAQLGAHWQGLFLTERHRLGLALSPPAPPPELVRTSRPATLEEIKAVAAVVSHGLLDLDEGMRIDGTAWLQGMAHGPEFGVGQPFDVVVSDAVSGRSLNGLRERVADHLGSHGLVLPVDEAEQRKALYAWGQAMATALAGRKKRDQGEVVETPAKPDLPDSLERGAGADLSAYDKPAHLLMLRDVLELWKKKGKPPTAKTIDTAERVVSQFEEVCGNPPLLKLTRQDGLKFRDWLLTQGQSPRTAADRLGYVSRLIRFEMQEQQRVTVNPWATIKIEGSRERVTLRKPIKADKLAALFAAQLFQAYDLPLLKSAGRDAAYWIPVLGAFTGARVTELAQLLVTDIRQDGDLWCIAIKDEQEWQSVKNSPSKRVIPMHHELVRLRLPEYAAKMKQAGHERLFPMAPVSALNNAGGPFATWFSKLKIAHGWGPENTFHSFRHTIETMLKRKKVYPFNINAYTGHKQQGGDADTTYSHPEPADLLDVAEAVQHEGLVLPRVFPPEGWAPPPLVDGILTTKPR